MIDILPGSLVPKEHAEVVPVQGAELTTHLTPAQAALQIAEAVKS
jgi:hypothetical protein